jgi:hypothetical protein
MADDGNLISGRRVAMIHFIGGAFTVSGTGAGTSI